MSDFVPTSVQITTKVMPGFFYARPSASAAINVAEIARVAGTRSSPTLSAAKYVKLIADSAWNQSHFTYAMKGVQNYSTYGYPGPQYAKSGGTFKLLWIPLPDGSEPEDVFGSPVAPPTTPESPPVQAPPSTERGTVATPKLVAKVTSPSRTTSSYSRMTNSDAGANYLDELFEGGAGKVKLGLLLVGAGIAVAAVIALTGKKDSRKTKTTRPKKKAKGRN